MQSREPRIRSSSCALFCLISSRARYNQRPSKISMRKLERSAMKHPRNAKTFLVNVLENLVRVSKLRAIDNEGKKSSERLRLTC